MDHQEQEHLDCEQVHGLRQDIKWKIGSYRNIYSQVTGPGMVTTFSPRMAMQWTNYVNNGAKVYKFTGTQFTKAFGGQWDPNFTPTNATRWLRQKFGRSIKAVAHGRGSTWLVATTTNINKGPFKNYTWK